MAVGPSGAVFVATGPPGDGLIRKTDAAGVSLLRTGVVSRPATPSVAGRSAAPGWLAAGGDGGVVVAAGVKLLALDSAGTVLTTVAGDPSATTDSVGHESSGDGGPALLARFATIRTIAGDRHGNIYVAEQIAGGGSVRVRFVNRSPDPRTFYLGTPFERTVAPGQVETIAGAPGDENAGDGGPALSATLVGGPPSMAVVGDRLYMGLYSASAGGKPAQAHVRMVNLGGQSLGAHGVTVEPGSVATVAGRGRAGFAGDGGPALQAAFSRLPGIAADQSGRLYLADETHHRARLVDDDGTMTTFAGTGDVGPDGGGFNGNDRAAVAARLNRPFDVKVGEAGNVFISDRGNAQVRMVDTAGVIHAAPGNGPFWRCLSGATPQRGRLAGVAAAATATYFADATTGLVMQRRGSRVAPAPAQPMSTRVDGPKALSVLATGRAGVVYVIAAGGQGEPVVRVVNPGRRPITVHGTRVPAESVRSLELSEPAEGGSRMSFRPAAGAADAAGNLFLSDPDGGRVVRVDGEGVASAVVGTGAVGGGGDCCARPLALAVDRGGGLYVADQATSRVWLMNLGSRRVRAHGQIVDRGAVVPVAGDGRQGPPEEEGQGALSSSISLPEAMAVDGEGTLYMTDPVDHSVRGADAAGKLRTVVGTGGAGFNGDGMKALLTALDSPQGLSVDACGNLLVADAGNSRIRLVHLRSRCEDAAPVRADQDEARGLRLLGVGLGAAAVSAGLLALGWRRRTRLR